MLHISNSFSMEKQEEPRGEEAKTEERGERRKMICTCVRRWRHVKRLETQKHGRMTFNPSQLKKKK
jgi:hypothetical protein